MKNKEVIEKILAYHPDLGKDYAGCDEWKCGNPEDECTGIVVALVPTVEVIQKAHALGANLIITHEVLYYQTPDYPTWKGCFDNAIQKEKEQLIQEYKMTIWRDHDHMHAHNPDSIFTGVIKYLGWENYKRFDWGEGVLGLMPFEIPETTLEDLMNHIKKCIGLNGIRYVGNPEDKVTRIAIAGHLYPNSFESEGIMEDGYYHDYALSIMQRMEKYDIQVLLPGEIIEWTILSYIRDAMQLGKIRACINLGHFNWEELGMKYYKNWLEPLINKEVNIDYVPSNDMYRYI